MSDAPLLTASYLAEIIADSGCDLSDDAAITEALVAKGIRPSQCGEPWPDMVRIAREIKAGANRPSLFEKVATGAAMAVGFAAYAFLTIIETGAV